MNKLTHIPGQSKVHYPNTRLELRFEFKAPMLHSNLHHIKSSVTSLGNVCWMLKLKLKSELLGPNVGDRKLFET